MTYDPRQISPPEPHPDDVADCAECGAVIYREDAEPIALNGRVYWLCADDTCLPRFCQGIADDLTNLRSRSQRLIEQVTHGIMHSGNVDFGRWDIEPTQLFETGESYLVLKPAPDHGRYRVVQLADD